MRIPATPATTALIIQFNSATRSGDTPLTYAPTCVSATARVARPNLVYLNAAARARVRPTIVSARYARSASTTIDPSSHRPVGKMGRTLTVAVPSRMAMVPWMTTSTPSDAAARASSGASRRGRNTRR